MDKETLSNYGWIVICILILAVMLAFATPFGTFVSDAVWSATNGLFDVNKNAMEAAGIVIDHTVDLSGKTEVAMLDGDHLNYNRKEPITLSFRSPAEYADFEAVAVDGEMVDSSNYTVTEGSTIVTFTPEYSAALALGNHTVDIVSKTSYAKGTVKVYEPDPALNPSGTIPEDATYKTWDGTVYNPGDAFPTVSAGDTYTYGDYTYTYQGTTSEFYPDASGWNAKVVSKFQTEYAPILETIGGKPITGLASCFYECKSMTVAPKIPDTVTDMEFAFWKCEALTAMPELPDSVGTLQQAFYYCKALTGTTAIPKNCVYLTNAFQGCTSLVNPPDMTKAVNVKYMSQAFANCTALTAAPDWSNSPNITTFEKVFRGCYNLKTVPATICAENVAYMFDGCTSLTGTINVNIPKLSTCTGMFEDVKLVAQGVTVTGTLNGKTSLYTLTSTAVGRGYE